jgi:predicted RNA-binding Zn ribbon-like protein
VASYVVDGLVLPVSVGGHPVLDFCNTRAGWGAAAPKEYLHSYAHLARWAMDNGLLPGPPRTVRTATGRAVLDRALALREALHAVLVGPPRDGGRQEWSVINREVRAAYATATLVANADEAAPAAWWLDPAVPHAALAAVAFSSAGFLTSPAAGSVGACPGVGCGWVFADPRRRRRWCSMAWCGNRAKARRHSQRRRGTVDALD